MTTLVIFIGFCGSRVGNAVWGKVTNKHPRIQRSSISLAPKRKKTFDHSSTKWTKYNLCDNSNHITIKTYHNAVTTTYYLTVLLWVQRLYPRKMSCNAAVALAAVARLKNLNLAAINFCHSALAAAIIWQITLHVKYISLMFASHFN